MIIEEVKMEEKLILKNNLKEARTEAKLSQSALAKMVGDRKSTRLNSSH